MLRWPVKSALYIDFENVPLPPEAIANWLAWLEDGMFEAAGRRRTFLQKRVYWNSHAERHRQTFAAHGFTPILVGKYSGLKNGADIRMAMDVVEATYTSSQIDEFLLLTGDSDFVPVLDRLREKSKRAAIVVTEHRPNIHTTYSLHADILIASRRLAEAAQYRRPKRGWIDFVLGRSAAKIAVKPALPPRKVGNGKLAATDAPRSLPPPANPEQPLPTAHSGALPKANLEQALQLVVGLMAKQPNNFIAQRRVLGELDRVPGFQRHGAGAMLGHSSYRALIQALARLDDRIRVVGQPGGGTGVIFVPRPAAAPKSGQADATSGATQGGAAITAQGRPTECATAKRTQPAAVPQPQQATTPDHAPAKSVAAVAANAAVAAVVTAAAIAAADRSAQALREGLKAHSGRDASMAPDAQQAETAPQPADRLRSTA